MGDGNLSEVEINAPVGVPGLGPPAMSRLNLLASAQGLAASQAKCARARSAASRR